MAVEGSTGRLNAVDILGVRVHCIDKQGILELVRQWSHEGQPRMISYVNAHCLNVACRDGGYRARLNEADLVYTDGVGVVWAGKFLHSCKLYKVTGRSWIEDFCELAAKQEIKIYVLAGKPGVAGKAAENLVKKHPELQIAGICDGFFREKNEEEVLGEIAIKKPNIIFVGMGVPYQEKWMAEHRSQISTPVCWAVGALFDYVAQREPRVPQWMDAIALEWLWRLLIDPAGKWRRYLAGNPIFVARILQQKLLRPG